MATSSLICLSFFLLFSCATCFNITRILDTYPDYKTFNEYLTKTKLADEINKRQTITVLAVANDAMGGVQGSDEAIRRIMSNHVVLDYYDDAKLSKLSKGTALLTTLFQSTGDAMYQQGFLNVTHMKSGEVLFGSAVKGEAHNSKLVKKIAAQPYNISVLAISAPIIADGIQNVNHTATPPPPPPPSHSPAGSPKKAPSPKASKASPPSADAPEPTTADAPEPASDTPASSPPSPVADAPTADAPKPADKQKSSGARVTVGACVGMIAVAVSSWVAL